MKKVNHDILINFINRLKKLNIDIKLSCNYPWIYIDSINGRRVTEKYQSDHNFTIAFAPIKHGENIKFTDLKTIFKIIRKYTNGS